MANANAFGDGDGRAVVGRAGVQRTNHEDRFVSRCNKPLGRLSYAWTRRTVLIAAPLLLFGLVAFPFFGAHFPSRDIYETGHDYPTNSAANFPWFGHSTGASRLPELPHDFDWEAYIKWNPELELEDITTKDMAEQHFLREGYLRNMVHRDYDLTIRYTACGGLMNQHYSHISALTLAHLSNANRIIWPPMQERESFNKRYHPDVTRNEQGWIYLDATTLWDMDYIQRAFRDQYGIEVLKHPDNVPMPDMTQLETAFQLYLPADQTYQSELRFSKPVYLARHNPYMLARAIMDAGRQVLLKHGKQPESVLVDLPCTMFMTDNRNFTVVEDIARLVKFSPNVTALARKVIRGIHEKEGVEVYNGVHLRMERDAMDWAIIMGGRERYWKLYRSSMAMARFSRDTPLFVASGLLKGSRNINTENGAVTAAADTQAVNQMQKLAQEIVSANLASKVVHKEMYLTDEELNSLSNEQSGLIDMLVLRESERLVGISVSTFSFYLSELRLMDGHGPEDTVLLDAYYIGTDELFYSCAITAIQTRARLQKAGRLHDTCKRPSGRRCFDPL
eukprot:jgi/Ulvmu1/5923/UM026_0045.1